MAQMLDVLDVVNAISLPLKAAWIVWLGWGIGQIFWYQREHIDMVTAPAPAPRPRPRRPVPSTRIITEEPAAAVETPAMESAEAS